MPNLSGSRILSQNLGSIGREVGFVAGDDGIGHAKPVDDVQKKLDGLLGIDCGYRFCLYPFCELVHCDK